MSKAILIVDTDDCAGCPAAIHDEIDGCSMCQAMGLKDIPDHFSRPNWCPLILEPERMSNWKREQGTLNDRDYETGMAYVTGLTDGWNACLDVLDGAIHGGGE